VAQSVEQTHHVEELERLNKQLEQTANKLYAKDVELTLANQKLQTLEAAKSKFIAVTTHQLRTPLAAVKWTFDLVIKEQLGSLTAEQKEFLQKGYQSAQRIITVVNELLNAGSFDRTDDAMNFVQVNFMELLDSVVFEFTNQSESKNIKLEVLKPSKALPLITLDPEKIRMVLENLIDNAIKYTHKNGAVTIVVDDAKINTVNPSIDLVVSDTGIGILPEDQKKIFQKFYRAANAVQVEPDGTGLGLFIGRDIIIKHHGTIWFVSDPGQGTKFHVTLPINQPKQ
jgi:signal transduction histidine kinase